MQHVFHPPLYTPRARNISGATLPTAIACLLVFFLAACSPHPPAAPPDMSWNASSEETNSQPPPSQGNTTIPDKVSLPQALERAWAENPDRAAVTARLAEAEALIAERQAAFWPSLKVYNEFLQGESPSASLFKSIDQRQLNQRTADFNRPGRFQNFETGLTASYSLYNGQRNQLRLQMAKHHKAAVTQARAEVNNELSAAVTDTFCAIGVAQKALEIDRKRINVLKKEIRLAKARYKAGGTLKADLLSLQARLSKARAQQSQNRAEAKSARAALAVLMDLPPEHAPEVAPLDSLPLEVPSNYQEALAHAAAHHPALARAREKAQKAHIGLDLAWASYLPRLSAQAHYYHDDPHMEYSRDRENWTLGLMLNWDLFSGFRRQAKVDKAHATLAATRAENRKTSQRIRQNIIQDLARIQAAEDQLTATRKQVAQAEEALRLVRIRFQGGSAALTRFLGAELAYHEALADQNTAHYALLRAQAALAQDVGAWQQKQTNAMPAPTPSPSSP